MSVESGLAMSQQALPTSEVLPASLDSLLGAPLHIKKIFSAIFLLFSTLYISL